MPIAYDGARAKISARPVDRARRSQTPLKEIPIAGGYQEYFFGKSPDLHKPW
jgi:hypothetical protein